MYPLKMVIFNSYVRLPEDKSGKKVIGFFLKNHVS